MLVFDNFFFLFSFFFLCGWLSVLAMLGQGFCCCSNNDNNITRRGLGAESFSLMTTQQQHVSSSVFVSSRPAPLCSSSSPSISKCIRKTSPSSLSCAAAAAATDFIIFLQGALLLLLPLRRFVRSRLYPFAFDCRYQFSLSSLFSPDESSFRVPSLTKLSSSVIHVPLSFRVLGFIRGQGGGSSLLSILRAILQLLQQRVFSLLKLSCFDFFFLFFLVFFYLRVLLCSFLPSCSSLSSFSSPPPPLACCNRFLDSSKLLTRPMWKLEILRVSFFTTSDRKSNREFCLSRGGWGERWIVQGW